jgi:hypothetical protein
LEGNVCVNISFIIAACMVAMGAAVPIAAPQSENQQIMLSNSTVVTRDTVRLSDLLSDSVEENILKVARELDLGPAPQIGKVRFINEREIRWRLRNNPKLLALLMIPAEISVQRAAYPIALDAVQKSVVEFVTERGWSLGIDRLYLLQPAASAPQALIKDPALEVNHASLDSRRHELQFEMGCAQRMCGKFIARAAAPEGGISPADATLDQRLRSSTKTTREKSGIASHQQASLPVLVQAGRPAVLVFESDGIRIKLPVICLQRGTLSQQIMARAVESHRIFRARVVGEKLLQAAF